MFVSQDTEQRQKWKTSRQIKDLRAIAKSQYRQQEQIFIRILDPNGEDIAVESPQLVNHPLYLAIRIYSLFTLRDNCMQI
jgi:hypothetical protein